MRRIDHSYPLRRWRLANFKSVKQADIDLAPLTVLVGANSSGKSSLIQSVLMVVQAAQTHSREAALPLNGPYVELGDFRSVKNATAGSRDKVAVGASFSLPIRPAQVDHPPVSAGPTSTSREAKIEWDAELLNAGRDDAPGRAHLSGVRFVAPIPYAVLDRFRGNSFFFEARKRAKGNLQLRRGTRRAQFQPILCLEGQLRLDEGPRGRSRVRIAGIAHRAGVPLSVFVRGEQELVDAVEWVRRVRQVLRDRRKNPRTEWDRIRDRRRDDRSRPAADRTEGLMNELATASCDRLIDLIVDAVAEQDESAASAPARARSVMDSVESIRGDAVSRGYWRQLHSLANDPKFARAVERRISGGRPVLVPAEEDDRSRELAQGLEASGVSVASFLANQVLYLGPLRQDPQILYVAAPAEQAGYVGKKGEYAIAVLHKDAERSVWCPLSDGGVQHVPLRQAVNHWLETFGLADSIDTIYRPRLGLEPQIEVPDVARPLDMTAVGVGVSQLLPVLVMGLHSEPGALLVFEQPELHLHPAMQQILADFLIACVRSGRQVLVETHSDHFVTRLRRRIAEDERDQTVDLIGLVFTERIDGSTRFRRLDTNRYGGVEEWPEGFFDQGPRDSQKLLRAGMQKKHKGVSR